MITATATAPAAWSARVQDRRARRGTWPYGFAGKADLYTGPRCPHTGTSAGWPEWRTHGPIKDLTEPGTEVILEPGDAIFYEDDVVHTARGAGSEEAVVLGTLLLTTGEPLLMPADEMAGMAATPAP